MLNNKSRRIALTCSYIPTEIFEVFNLCAVRPTISQEDLSSPIPLILSGTCLLDESLLFLARQLNIEITFLDSCFDQRDRPKTITPNDDFLFSLSLSYLQKPPCPRMTDKNRRLAWLQELIKEEKANVQPEQVAF